MNTLKAVKDYINSNIADRALLITGEWGSGKTHFWKNEIVGFLKSKKLKPIYISLNGLKSVGQIETQLILQAFPQKYRGKFVNNMMEVLSRKLFSTELSELSGSLRPKIDDAVICYDDLERCKIPLQELWGFVNYDIEQSGTKTIILSNHDEIEDKSFKSIQEKNVGRLIMYEPNIESIYKALVKDYESADPEFYKLLEETQEYMIDLINRFEIKNFRTVKTFLESINMLSKADFKSKNLFRKVMLFTLVVTNEQAIGNVGFNNTKAFLEMNLSKTDFRLIRNLWKSDEIEGKERVKDYSEKFFERYIDKVDTGNFHFFQSVFDFIVTGFLNEEKYRDELKGLSMLGISKITPSANVFSKVMGFGFRNLEDQEFNDLIDELFGYIDQGEYLVYEFDTLANNLSFFLSIGLINMKEEELQKRLIEGIRISAESMSRSDYLLDNVMAFPAQNNLVKAIRKEIKKAHEGSIVSEAKSKQKELLEAIKRDDRDLISSIFHQYKYKPLFTEKSSEDLAQSLLNSTNPSLTHIDKILAERYKISHPDYKLEMEGLSSIIEFLKQELNGKKETTVKVILLKEILDSFENGLVN